MVALLSVLRTRKEFNAEATEGQTNTDRPMRSAPQKKRHLGGLGAELLAQPDRDGEQQNKQREIKRPTHHGQDSPFSAFLAAIPPFKHDIGRIIRRKKDEECGEPIACE